MVTKNGCGFCRQKSYLCPEDICPACGTRIIPDTDIEGTAGLNTTATSTWRIPPTSRVAVAEVQPEVITEGVAIPEGIPCLSAGEARLIYEQA